jgi:chromosomal replication initiation ATPase DnaA
LEEETVARPLRIEFPGAFYHVTTRGNEPKALRELNDKPSLDEIAKVVREVFSENDRQARNAGIYLCHRYSGSKLKEIGKLFHLTESGVTRASKRFDEAMERDKALKEKMGKIRGKLKLSIA